MNVNAGVYSLLNVYSKCSANISYALIWNVINILDCTWILFVTWNSWSVNVSYIFFLQFLLIQTVSDLKEKINTIHKHADILLTGAVKFHSTLSFGWKGPPCTDGTLFQKIYFGLIVFFPACQQANNFILKKKRK